MNEDFSEYFAGPEDDDEYMSDDDYVTIHVFSGGNMRFKWDDIYPAIRQGLEEVGLDYEVV